LENYGPPRRTVHPEYPFWWLQTDRLWEIENASSLRRRSTDKEPLRSDLLSMNVKGGLPEDIYHVISGNRRLLDVAANNLLHAHFPDSLHEPILNEIGLSLIPDRRRDLAFRESVIQAYERRCAVCGYDVRLGRAEIGLEAAHIKWWQVRGPDEVQNGLALCSTHHRAFDLGAIGLTDELTILISGEVNGQSWTRQLFHEFNGRRIHEPHSKSLLPRDVYLRWHRSQVFRGPARDL
jgi:putative restriction endonuclease